MKPVRSLVCYPYARWAGGLSLYPYTEIAPSIEWAISDPIHIHNLLIVNIIREKQ